MLFVRRLFWQRGRLSGHPGDKAFSRAMRLLRMAQHTHTKANICTSHTQTPYVWGSEVHRGVRRECRPLEPP